VIDSYNRLASETWIRLPAKEAARVT
jgi:hypothetical protein